MKEAIQQIIQCIDLWLEQNHETEVAAVQAAEILDKAGLLKDSKSRPGLPLRNKLRDNEIPHAYQRGSYWYIPHSKCIEEELRAVDGSGKRPETMGKGRCHSRDISDEFYVIDLCDEVLQEKALRQHTFDFLKGDTGCLLPVDAYYEQKRLVVEYYEKQHSESVSFFDRKMTASGVTRNVQRKMYDERRKELLPKHGIRVLTISYSDFAFDGRKRIIRQYEKDLEIVKRILNEYLPEG